MLVNGAPEEPPHASHFEQEEAQGLIVEQVFQELLRFTRGLLGVDKNPVTQGKLHQGNAQMGALDVGLKVGGGRVTWPTHDGLPAGSS